MTSLQAAYFIDEINHILVKATSPDTVTQFWKRNSVFMAKGLPQFIQKDMPSPLMKAAWNIATRGVPTRASIILSEFLLNKYIKELYEGKTENAPEISFKISKSFSSQLDSDLVLEILENFQFMTEKDLVEFGHPYFSLYKILHALISTAQIQMCILLKLLEDDTENTTSFHILGMDAEISSLIIEDLNHLFKALNTLSSEEKQLPAIICEKEHQPGTTTIAVNIISDGISITQFASNDDSSYYYNIFTDRHIAYKPLGRTIRTEKENEYEEYFEFKTKKQEKALTYFLQNIFRKSKFRPGQEPIINRAIQTRDVIGLLPTGGGKSLTYQMCGLLQPGIMVIIDPINSLMKDQFDKLIQNGISRAAFINSMNTKEEREYHLEQLAEGKYLFVFISPERLQIQKFRTALASSSQQKVYYSYAVIDEAHCVSEWGHDFRHSYLKLAQNLRRYCQPKQARLPLFGLTATASFDVLADVQRELEMADDSIITLPPKAIDREELNFEVIPVELDLNNDVVWHVREKSLGALKYPAIKNLLKELPGKIRKIEKKYGYLSTSEDFYAQEDLEYKNAGIIFCPSKTDKLPFGVLYLKNGGSTSYNRDSLTGLNTLPFLSIGTFFGRLDDDTVPDEHINKEALESEKNQEIFLRNESNLMIATKAFGMGIDKPNIRFTIHYSFPNSVESFYQEAGRAGRDGLPSICSIVFNPADKLMNLDFFASSFRGIKREKEIIDELLDEVHYEDNFFLNVFQNTLRDFAPEVNSVTIGKDSFKQERYIYINGRNEFVNEGGTWRLKDPAKGISIGLLDTKRNLVSYPDSTRNFDFDRAQTILAHARTLLKELSPNGDYLKWFKTKKADGINTLIAKDANKEHVLKIGFTNDIISIMAEKIRAIGYSDFDAVIVRAAYKFSQDVEEFLNDLDFRYSSQHGFNVHLNLDLHPETKNFLKESYYRIRNSSDTLKAIYRMSILGIIDDYTIDYARGYLEVKFRGKPEKEYKENLRVYLRRYLGVETTNSWLEKANKHKAESTLKRVLYTLIEFIDEEIGEKRKRSIEYMMELCNVFITDGEREFRDRMIRYFTSKYARSDYLPRSTENGTIENAAIIKEYIGYIFNPPDGLGGQIDNAKHLRGACDNLRINMRENASIDLLTAFSYFALDARPDRDLEQQEQSQLFIQAKDLFRRGFKRLVQIEDWKTCKELLTFFNEKAIDINPEVKPLIEPFTNEILISRTTFRLNQLLTKISNHE